MQLTKTAIETDRVAITLLMPEMQGAGAQRVMLNLANGMSERGYVVTLVLAKAVGPYLEQIHPDVRVVDLGASRILASLPALTQYLRTERPAVVISGLGNMNNVLLWAKQLARVDTRIIVSEHNTLSVATDNAPNWRDRQMPKLIGRFYPWADEIIAVSQGVANDLADSTGLAREGITVIYNPVITDEIKQKAAAPLAHPWFAPGEPPVVLGVGRLTEQKNFELLLRAFADARASMPMRLLILGDGKDRARLERIVDELGLGESVSLPGFVDNPYPYMRKADTFVLSSKWEGLPTVLIEALYCGAKVVATDCPSGPREILDEGAYGLLVPVDNQEALTQAIVESVSGRIPNPPAESWQPYELEHCIDQYVDAIAGISPT